MVFFFSTVNRGISFINYTLNQFTQIKNFRFDAFLSPVEEKERATAFTPQQTESGLIYINKHLYRIRKHTLTLNNTGDILTIHLRHKNQHQNKKPKEEKKKLKAPL